MKLKKLLITGYRSIKSTEPLLLDERVTILIGANDHGKSNLLAAIRCLNDDDKINSEDRNWDLPEDSLVQIEWEFEPSKAELDSLKVHEIKLKAKSVKQVVVATPVGQAGLVEAAADIKEGQPQEEYLPLNSTNKIIFYRDNKSNTVKVKNLPLRIPASKESIILQMRPRVEFFESPTGNVKDEVSLAELEKPEFEFMQGIFRLAEIWNNRATIFTQNAASSKLLDEAGKKLTKILNDKWNQGKDLGWKLTHTGTNGDHIMIEINDPSIDSRYSRPSLRSSGFKTYFLLSMITLARKENKPSDSFLFLFDEPGTYLHPHAQLDLQRSFEAIADNTQILYTTHSIFLINKNHPSRNRVISKHKEGTKIDQKPFSKNWKSVRESLGILLSNNFLIAEKTLLVEGPSDVVYIHNVIKKLKSIGEIDIDLNDLSIVDSGTSENYIAMARLMLSEGRSVVALLDGDKSGQEIEKQLQKSCTKEYKSKQLQIHSLPENKSIEDVAVVLKVLKSAIKTVVRNLISGGERVLVEKLDIDKSVEIINFQKDKTLGRFIDETTKLWFEPNAKISKFSIALEYENQSTDESVNPNSKNEISVIKKLLNLRGEKSAESGVFDEVE